MTVFLNDTFTDTDNVLLEDHAPDLGGTWVQFTGGATQLIISSNECVSEASGLSVYSNTAPPGNAEYDNKCDWIVGASGNPLIFLVVRFLDANNYYWVQHIASTGSLLIRKRIGGVFTTLASTTDALTLGATYPLELRVRSTGTTLEYFRSAVSRLSATDGDLTAAGEAGIGSDNEGSLDNLVVDDVGAPAAANASMMPMHVWWARS